MLKTLQRQHDSKESVQLPLSPLRHSFFYLPTSPLPRHCLTTGSPQLHHCGSPLQHSFLYLLASPLHRPNIPDRTHPQPPNALATCYLPLATCHLLCTTYHVLLIMYYWFHLQVATEKLSRAQSRIDALILERHEKKRPFGVDDATLPAIPSASGVEGLGNGPRVDVAGSHLVKQAADE